jgi:hypothetical protein
MKDSHAHIARLFTPVQVVVVVGGGVNDTATFPKYG